MQYNCLPVRLSSFRNVISGSGAPPVERVARCDTATHPRPNPPPDRYESRHSIMSQRSLLRMQRDTCSTSSRRTGRHRGRTRRPSRALRHDSQRLISRTGYATSISRATARRAADDVIVAAVRDLTLTEPKNQLGSTHPDEAFRHLSPTRHEPMANTQRPVSTQAIDSARDPHHCWSPQGVDT